MKQILPEPKLLPIRVNVLLNSSYTMKQFMINNVLQVKPYETLGDLVAMIKDFYVKKGDPVTVFELEKLGIQ